MCAVILTSRVLDVPYEAAKLPMDVAIFNSARAAGSEKSKKFLQTVIVVGGSARIPGIIHALESRRDQKAEEGLSETVTDDL